MEQEPKKQELAKHFSRIYQNENRATALPKQSEDEDVDKDEDDVIITVFCSTGETSHF